MRHRAPRTLDFLKSFTFPRSSRYLLAGRRRAGWLIANQKTRLTLAMASVMVLACAAVVAATEIPGEDDSVAATDAPTSAAQALRSGTAEQVSRSSGRTPWDMSDDAPTQDAPDQLAPEGPQPGSDGTGVPSPDPEEEPATPDGPAPVPSPELPSQTPTTDGGGLGVSSPPSLPTSTPTEPSEDPEKSADESSDDREDSSGSGGGEESFDQTAPETEIVSSPTVTDSAVSASSFEFTANESATFMCSLDGQAYVQCGSPTEYGELSPGWHTFAVQATDATGNVDPNPAQVSWLTTGADSAHLVDKVTPSDDSLLP